MSKSTLYQRVILGVRYSSNSKMKNNQTFVYILNTELQAQDILSEYNIRFLYFLFLRIKTSLLMYKLFILLLLILVLLLIISSEDASTTKIRIRLHHYKNGTESSIECKRWKIITKRRRPLIYYKDIDTYAYTQCIILCFSFKMFFHHREHCRADTTKRLYANMVSDRIKI